MSLTRKPSQPREVQFTTDFPQLPPDAPASMGPWYRDLISRIKSDQQTVEDAVAKLNDELEALNSSAAITALTERVAALENAPLRKWLVFDRDVADGAGIQEAKLALQFPTHSNANDPTSDQKGALAGTAGVPSNTNRYVTDADGRLGTGTLTGDVILSFFSDAGRKETSDASEIIAHLLAGGQLRASEFIKTLLDDVDAATARTTLGITGTGLQDMLLYQHRESSGSSGGTFNSGARRKVPLNTEVIDTGNHGSIASNEITLDAGTYRYQYGVVGYRVDDFQGNLYNVTDAAVVSDSYGTVARSDAAGGEVVQSSGQGKFTLASSKTMRLEAQCTTSGTGSGFGLSAAFGGGEIFSWLILMRE